MTRTNREEYTISVGTILQMFGEISGCSQIPLKFHQHLFFSRSRLKENSENNSKYVVLEQCKRVICVDLGESFQTHTYLQKFASIQPRTSPVKFAASRDGRSPGRGRAGVVGIPGAGRVVEGTWEPTARSRVGCSGAGLRRSALQIGEGGFTYVPPRVGGKEANEIMNSIELNVMNHDS